MTSEKCINENNKVNDNGNSCNEKREENEPFANCNVFFLRMLTNVLIKKSCKVEVERKNDNQRRDRKADCSRVWVIICLERVLKKYIDIFKQESKQAYCTDIQCYYCANP